MKWEMIILAFDNDDYNSLLDVEYFAQILFYKFHFTKELFGIEIKINSLNDFKASVFET